MEYAKNFPIEGGKFYRLTFKVETSAKIRWVLHQYDNSGNLPFDGAIEGEWQRIAPKKTPAALYTHEFLALENSVELRLGFTGKTKPKLLEATLEPITPTNMIINSDFSLGLDNYSGWSQTHWSELREENGTNLLFVKQNGYALSDYFPVKSGGGYNYIKGIDPWPKVLAYDQNRRLIATVPHIRTNKPSLQIPEGAAFARLLYETWHDHIPAYRARQIKIVGLEATDPAHAVSFATLPPHEGFEIVLPPNSDPREIYAARELQHWLWQITGKLPSLLAMPSKQKNTKIHVGTTFADSFPDDTKWLADTDGFAVRRRGNDVYVFGVKPRGVIYGVFALLERNSDIIWPRYNPDFEAIWTPNPRLSLKQTDFRSKPTFALRHISVGQKGYRFQEWLTRNGLNSEVYLHTGLDYLFWERGAPATYSHSHLGWLGDAKDKDQTLYPMIDGKRDLSHWRQPCYTHPETPTIIAANIRKALKLIPDQPVENITSIIADNWGVCACPRCMEPIKLTDGTTLAPKSPYSEKDSLFFSTRNFMMLNAVAENLARDYPNLKLVTHAYIFTAEPPLVKLHPMIVPQFAAYPTKNSRFPLLDDPGDADGPMDQAEKWKQRFLAWGKLHPHGLGYFGYYYTPGYNALSDTAAADYSALAKQGAVFVHTEGYDTDGASANMWDADGVEKWIITRLMWDPNQDPAALRNAYIEKVYREAAPEMKSFYALINRVWHDKNIKLFVNCHSSAQNLFTELLVKPGIEKEAHALLTAAVAAAQEPKTKALTQRALAQFEQLRGTLGRLIIPLVQESSIEWHESASTHWQKALKINEFKKVSDWRNYDKTPADHATEARLMHDGKNLYIRVSAEDDDPAKIIAPPLAETERFPNGDRFEFIYLDNKSKQHYVAIGPNGNRYTSPQYSEPPKVVVSKQAKSWCALIAIPLSELQLAEEQTSFKARVGRVYRLKGEEREESTPNGASLYNQHDSFWNELIFEGKEQ